MNIFRLIGDSSHLLAIILLLVKIYKTKSCSGKSQIMFAMVFTFRYLDLVVLYISLYNTIMKILFIVLSYITVYFIYFKFKHTASEDTDSFRLIFILAPIAGLAFLISWTFSIYLESVAILPQLFMISKTGEAETITTHYLFALGMYRALYLVNWVYRYHMEHFFDPIAIVAGCVQTILYLDFFYLYFTRVLKGRRLILPV